MTCAPLSLAGFFRLTLIALLSSCGLPALGAEQTPLQLVAASMDSPLVNPALPCRQAHIVIALEAMHRAGLTVVCEPVPWKRAQVMVQEGERDAMVTLLTPERAAYSVASSEIVYQSHMTAFIRANHPQRQLLSSIRTIEQLKPWRVLSYLGDGWAKTRLETTGIQIDWSRDMVTVLNKLLANRGDVCISNDVLIMPLLHSLELQDSIIMLDSNFESFDFQLLIGKGSPYLMQMPAIDAALKKMREDGSSARLAKDLLTPASAP